MWFVCEQWADWWYNRWSLWSCSAPHWGRTFTPLLPASCPSALTVTATPPHSPPPRTWYSSTLSTLPWEADGQAAWKILLNFIQFSDSSYWMFMPDIFDAWQSASSRWGCDQNLTSKHAKKLRSNCAIQCWLNKNFLWQPLSKQFEGKEKGQESTRQTANQAISAH